MKNIIEKANKSKPSLLAAGIFFIMANLFTVYFMSQERYIYFWDLITYWSKYTYLSEHFIGNTFNAIETVFWSIREDKYNHFPALLLMPFGLLFGTSRMAYILSIVNIFALPVVASFIVIHRKLTKAKESSGIFLPLIPVCVILLSPDFWNPILYGYLDVGGILLTNLILLLYLNNPFSKQSTRDLLLIAVLISILVIFRRWYAFWGVSFYIVLLMEICLVLFLTRPFDVKNFTKSLSKYFMQVSVSAVIFFLAVPTYGQKILGTNYVDLNSAYRLSMNLFQSFGVILNSFGLLYFSLFLLGAIGALINKKTRGFAMFVLVQSVIIFVMFARTQDFDTHHRYLLLPPVLFFSSLFLNHIFCKMKNFKILTLGCLAVLFALNYFIAFGPHEKFDKKPYPSVFTNIRHRPLVRNDFKEIERMLVTLKELLTGPEDRVYVLASSDILNSNMLHSAWMFFGRYKDICQKILPTHNVDKRNGFPLPLLTTQYVIVADPVQNPMDQWVVGIPTELFLGQKGVATSFQKLPYEFNLDGGVKAYIYKKIKPIQASDAAYISQMLERYYPGREDIYKIKDNSWTIKANEDNAKAIR